MEGRSPVLIDFGLARVADDPRLTRTGWLLGTPGYLAPEILYGDDADHRLRRARLGRHRGLRRAPAGRRSARGPCDGDHGPGPPRRARPVRRASTALLPLVRGCLAPDPADRPDARAERRCAALRGPRCRRRPATTPRCRSRWPRPRPRTTTAPTCSARVAVTAPLTTAATPSDGAAAGPRAVHAAATAAHAASPSTRRPAPVPPERRRPAPPGLPRLQRGARAAGLFAATTSASRSGARTSR